MFIIPVNSLNEFFERKVRGVHRQVNEFLPIKIKRKYIFLIISSGIFLKKSNTILFSTFSVGLYGETVYNIYR